MNVAAIVLAPGVARALMRRAANCSQILADVR